MGEVHKNQATISEFDISDYLDDDEVITEYLNTALEEGDNDDVLRAIRHVAKAVGIAAISNKSGLSRSNLHKALSDGAKPQFATIMKVLRALGRDIQVTPRDA